MFNLFSPRIKITRNSNHPLFAHRIVGVFLGLISISILGTQPAFAQTSPNCQLSPDAIAQKEQLRQAAIAGDPEADKQYKDLLTLHAQAVFQCRRRHPLKTQAIWLRLYPCDAKPHALEKILDDLINQGYNKVYLEVFYDGQVLLPSANNPTPWPSILRSPGTENIDLLAQTIQKGRRRGLQVYAWMFMLNYGYTYTQRPDRQQVLARNGNGDTTVTAIADGVDADDFGESYVNQGFIDPYSPLGRQDYQTLLNAVFQRRPKGVLFDYVRYPKGLGTASVATRVRDLWIYGEASQQILLQRPTNEKGQEFLRRFLKQGFITETDLTQVNQRYQDQENPIWPDETTLKTLGSIEPMGEGLQQQLWRLSVAHATQGVLDFLTFASQTVQRRGIPAGAVFFPEGNRKIRQQGFDSRLQPWNQFPASIEWHPMAYSVCGNTSCIVSQVQQVVSEAPPRTQVIPALAGVWGKPFKNRPALEEQMKAIQTAVPQIQGVSHYSYGWQEPVATRSRKTCQF